MSEVCDFLSLRGLPYWIIDHVHRGWRQDLSNESSVQEQPHQHNAGELLTGERLHQWGIAHPLHRRRVLRELQCLLRLKHPEERPSNAFGTVVTPARSQASREFQDVCLQRPKGPRRKRSFVKDPRWPFMLIECRPDLSPPGEGVGLPSPSGISHAQRRQQTASKVFGVDSQQSSRKTAEALNASQDLPPPTQCAQQRGTDVVSMTLSHLEVVETEEESISWEDWIHSRLHSNGMLSLVDDVFRVACSGNLADFSELMSRIEVHGKEFEESLARTPLPTYVQQYFPHMPSHPVPPQNIWEWLLWRLDLLESAEYRLTLLLGKASDLVDAVVGGRGPVHSDTSFLSGAERAEKAKRKTTINLKKVMQGKQFMEAAPDMPARSSSILSQPPRSTSLCSVHSQLDETGSSSSKKPGGGLARFKKTAHLVLSHIRAKRQDGLVLNTKLLTCISMQAKVMQTKHELAGLVKEIDEWPLLLSPSRSSSDDMVNRLQEASHALFERFVDLRQHKEMELREYTTGDQGVVDRFQLEAQIIDVQRELACELLLGESALQKADQMGVSLRAQGIPAPPNPWMEVKPLAEPPWEASFLRALRTLEPLKRNLKLRRQANAWRMDSDGPEKGGTPTGRSPRHRTMKLAELKAKNPIPEQVLAKMMTTK